MPRTAAISRRTWPAWIRWLRRTGSFEVAWEMERGSDPGLRWLCARCHLPGAEHPDQWWACAGRWLCPA